VSTQAQRVHAKGRIADVTQPRFRISRFSPCNPHNLTSLYCLISGKSGELSTFTAFEPITSFGGAVKLGSTTQLPEPSEATRQVIDRSVLLQRKEELDNQTDVLGSVPLGNHTTRVEGGDL
jgi:hypothetical protein